MEGCRLAVTDLACRRGDRVLFRGLSFELNAGEALQVAGPNGTGKSSLLRIVAGLLRPFAGTVEREGSIGLVDERPALDEHLPLGKALAFWARIDGDNHNPPRDGEVAARRADGGESPARVTVRAASPLHRLWRSPSPSRGGLGLDDLLDVPVQYLSTGQRKRAALARLLGQQAAIWLLDEPLNGLDAEAARACEALVAEHCANGGLALIASHQPFALAGMKSLHLADFIPPLPGGEGIEGWGSEAAGLASAGGGGAPPPNPGSSPGQAPPPRGEGL